MAKKERYDIWIPNQEQLGPVERVIGSEKEARQTAREYLNITNDIRKLKGQSLIPKVNIIKVK